MHINRCFIMKTEYDKFDERMPARPERGERTLRPSFFKDLLTRPLQTLREKASLSDHALWVRRRMITRTEKHDVFDLRCRRLQSDQTSRRRRRRLHSHLRDQLLQCVNLREITRGLDGRTNKEMGREMGFQRTSDGRSESIPKPQTRLPPTEMRNRYPHLRYQSFDEQIRPCPDGFKPKDE